MLSGHKLHKSFESRFQVYRNVAQLIPSGVNTRINFDVVQYDPLDEYDEAVLYQFQPQRAGYYHLLAGLTFPIMAVGTVFGLQMSVDGAGIHVFLRTSFAGTLGMASLSRQYYLTPANVVYIQAYQASGIGQNLVIGLDRTFFEGYRFG